MKLNLNTWNAYAKAIVYPAEETEYSPAAIEKFVHDMDDYIIDVKGVHPQFKALNSYSMIDFSTEEERKEYYTAWERWLAEKAKLEKKMDEGDGSSKFQILVQFLKFRQAAEKIRCPYIAKAMYESVTEHKQAAVAALNFKASIALCVKILHDTYGVDRNLISLIWGGGNTKVSKKRQKKLDAKKRITEDAKIAAMLEEMDIDMEDLGLDMVSEVEHKVVIDNNLRLGAQNQKQRQEEIDRFQKGKSLYCFFTFKSGGVGLSLHHSDELTKEKCRRKPDSGFAVEEDIPTIPTRPRICFVAPTYSAIELVQGLGRCPRLTSLSDTPQTILFYKGTIEERVAWIVSMKLRCLRKVTKSRESWESVILGGYKQDDVPSREASAIKSLVEDSNKPITDTESNGDSSDEPLDLEEDEEE